MIAAIDWLRRQLEGLLGTPPLAFMTGESGSAPPTREEIWKQISIHVDLYKHYLDLSLKFNAFYYALTGAIVSFYLSRPHPGVLRFSLLLPIALGYSLALVCFWGGILNLNTRGVFVAAARELGFTTWPEVSVLSVVLWLSAMLFCLVAVALTVALCLGDRLFAGAFG